MLREKNLRIRKVLIDSDFSWWNFMNRITKNTLVACCLLAWQIPCIGFSIYPMNEPLPDPGPELIDLPLQDTDLLDGGFGGHVVTSAGEEITGNEDTLTTWFGEKFVIGEGGSYRLYRMCKPASPSEEYERWSKYFREEISPAVGGAWRCTIPGEATVFVQLDQTGKLKLSKVVWFLAGVGTDGHTHLSDSQKNEFIDCISKSLASTKIRTKFPDNQIASFTFAGCFITWHSDSGVKTLRSLGIADFVRSYPSLHIGAILRASSAAQRLGYKDISQSLLEKAKTLSTNSTKQDRAMKRVLAVLRKAESNLKSETESSNVRPLLDQIWHDAIASQTAELLDKEEFERIAGLEFVRLPLDDARQAAISMSQGVHSMYSLEDYSEFMASCDLYTKTLLACNKQDPEQIQLYNQILSSYKTLLSLASGETAEQSAESVMLNVNTKGRGFDEKIKAEARSRLADLKKNVAPVK